MKNKYGIGFFAAALILLLLVSCAYQYTFQRAKEKAKEELEARYEALTEDEASLAADGHAMKEDCYYLMEVNGYVVVYLSDKKTAYEYTDILYDELPSGLRDEIRNGKYIESLDELYGFLENYSS